MSEVLRMLRRSLWAVVLAGPLIANAIVHAALVAPEQAKVRDWQETQWLLRQKPALETLLTRSSRLLMDWEQGRFTLEDPAEPLQVIQQLAGHHEVQIVSAKTSGQAFDDTARGRRGKKKQPKAAGKTAPGATLTPLIVEVTGPYSRLAQWLSDMEARAGFQIEFLQLEPERELNLPHRMTLKVNARLEPS